MSKYKTQEYKNEQLKLMQEYAAKYNGKCLAFEYVDSHTRYEWQDDTGVVWKAPWYNYKNKGGWSKSHGYAKNAKSLIKYTIESIQKEFAEPRGGRLVSTEYKNTKTKLEWQDSKGRLFSSPLEHVIAGQWSPHEKRETISKLKRKYDLEFCKNYASSFGGELMSAPEIITTASLITWKDRYGIIFDRKLVFVLNSKELIAPKKSMGEFKIEQFLKDNNVEYVKWDRKTLGNGKELDFYIPSLKLAIEYNGLFWHSDAKIDNNAHINKTKAANAVGIKLIQIFEHELSQNGDQVFSFLRSKLGLNSRRVFARKCDLRKVDKAEARTFLNKYHIQGSGNFTEAYGMFQGEELLMLVAIGKHHRKVGVNVLTRCVSKCDVTVVGGLSRLCKAAIQDYTELLTWVDLRWSNGKAWNACGWTIEYTIAPDYFYYHQNKKVVISKQSRKKSNVATPVEMTEREHATLDGLVRVYDCGKLALKLSK